MPLVVWNASVRSVCVGLPMAWNVSVWLVPEPLDVNVDGVRPPGVQVEPESPPSTQVFQVWSRSPWPFDIDCRDV
jgi:hypothetical protein